MGLKKEFETALVNESSVFEPLKFYCTYIFCSDAYAYACVPVRLMVKI